MCPMCPMNSTTPYERKRKRKDKKEKEKNTYRAQI
jgi:hypothetical protein